MALPDFNEAGDLPPDVHAALLSEVMSRFGQSNAARRVVGKRLQHVYAVANATGHLARFIVYGSFVTNKPEPNDVDVLLVMDEFFEVADCTGAARLLFDHQSADEHFGASVFWAARPVEFGGEQALIEYWQLKRDRTLRGIVEIQEVSS